MPLWYVGATPSLSTDVVSNNYISSLVSNSLSSTQINDRITAGFSILPYALNTWVDSQINKRDANGNLDSTALATRQFVDQGVLSKILTTSVGTANGPVALDSSQRVPKDRINVASTQRWPLAFWSPDSYPTVSAASTETTIRTINVSPGLSRYKLFVTGTINGKISVDGSYPLIQVRVGSATGQVIAVGNGLAESYKGGDQSAIITAGPYSYNIPTWCDKIDVVLIGGGGGGFNGAGLGFNGGGGGAGSWTGVTLTRGANLPTSTTTLTGVVGAGANNANLNTGSPGGTTTCIATGYPSTISAVGGKTGERQGSTTQGEGAADYSYGGWTYRGSEPTALPSVVPSRSGNAPGGGGQGGLGGALSGNPGGDGAAGAAYFYAYTTDDINYGQMSVLPQNLDTQTVLTAPTTLYVTVTRSGTGSVTTSSLNPKISVMAVPA